MRVERPLPAEGQGPRITELWAWTNIDPMTDTEGIIAAKMPNGVTLPLVTTVRDMADQMWPIVDEVIRSAAEPRPVARLRHFIQADEVLLDLESRLGPNPLPRRDDDYGQGAADA